MTTLVKVRVCLVLAGRVLELLLDKHPRGCNSKGRERSKHGHQKGRDRSRYWFN
jgi:hypothetical protein